MPAKLFHVSPAKNHVSIAKFGVEPLYSRGKRKTSWWVDQRKLAWALAHVSIGHQLPVNELEVWYRDGETAKGMKRSSWVGVYYTACQNKVEGYYRAETVLDLLARDQAIE